MLFKWLMPELNRLQPPCVRAMVTVRMMRMLGFTAGRGFALGVILLIPAVILTVNLQRGRMYGLGALVSIASIYILLIACVQIIWMLAVWPSVKYRIREELNQLGCLVCTRCGYNLTGNVSGICPECGDHA